jgi:fatty-acid desaturase
VGRLYGMNYERRLAFHGISKIVIPLGVLGGYLFTIMALVGTCCLCFSSVFCVVNSLGAVRSRGVSYVI